ncbi:hypothetical protein L1887_50705 [Cichorium endivia]|nr:hypothetical protein L1887_50705 [Cichorium endivia]
MAICDASAAETRLGGFASHTAEPHATIADSNRKQRRFAIKLDPRRALSCTDIPPHLLGSGLELLDLLFTDVYHPSRTSTRHAGLIFAARIRCIKTQPGPCLACAPSSHHTAPPVRPTTTTTPAARTQRSRAVPGQQSGAQSRTCTQSDRSFGSPRLALQPALPGAAAHSGVRQHGLLWPPPPLERARPRRTDQAHEPTRRLARGHRKKLGRQGGSRHPKACPVHSSVGTRTKPAKEALVLALLASYTQLNRVLYTINLILTSQSHSKTQVK